MKDKKFDPHAPYTPPKRPKGDCIPCGGWGYDKQSGARCPFCAGKGVVK